MDAFLQIPADERREASIEKDLWICWTLRELFALPGIGEHLTF